VGPTRRRAPLDLAPGEPTEVEAAAFGPLEQPAVVQRADCLPDGAAADPELGGQVSDSLSDNEYGSERTSGDRGGVARAQTDLFGG